MNRWIRLASLLPVVVLGLMSRLRPCGWEWYDHHLGDGLYAVAAFLMLGFLLPRLGRPGLAALALGLCWAVEGLKGTGPPTSTADSPIRWLLERPSPGPHLFWYFLGCRTRLAAGGGGGAVWQSGTRPP